MDDNYIQNTMSILKIASYITRKNEKYIDEAKILLDQKPNETTMVSIANIIMMFYASQYDIATTDAEREMVVNKLVDDAKAIFEDRYIPVECWRSIMRIRKNMGTFAACLDDAQVVIKSIDRAKFPVTAKYVYIKISNYIVNSGLFCTEPFTTILDEVVSGIDNKSYDPGAQPTYFN